MSTTINVTVGGNGLLDHSRQQMQANRFGKLERDADANTSAQIVNQRLVQVAPPVGRQDPVRRVRPEPAANRRTDDVIRIQANNRGGQLEFFTTDLPYELLGFEGNTIDLILLDAEGPFSDPVINGVGGPDWEVIIDTGSIKPLTSDFTLESWAWWPSTDTDNWYPYSFYCADSNYFRWNYDRRRSRFNLFLSSGGGRQDWRASMTGLSGTWIHVALVRKDGQFSIFVNGTKLPESDIYSTFGDFDPTAAWAPSYTQLGTPIVFGDTTSVVYWRMNQLALTRKSKYTANFVPPSRRV